MNYYSPNPRPIRDNSVGGFFELRTPGFVLSEMETVQNIVNQINSDLTAQRMSETDFGKAFAAFKSEWGSFYDENKDSWWARGTTPVYNKTIEFRNRSLDWAKRFRSLGGKTAAVLPPQKKEPSLFKWGGWLILAGIGTTWWFLRRR